MRKNYEGRFEVSSSLFKMLSQPNYESVVGSYIEAWEERYNEDIEADSTKKAEDKEGYWYLSHHKTAEVLSHIWFNVFTKHTDKLGVTCEYEGVYFPKEYNFRGDACDFVLNASGRVYDRLCKSALSAEGFGDWLYENYKSYDGFHSFYPDNIAGYIKEMNGEGHYEASTGYEKAIVIALAWHAFRDEEVCKDFDEEFVEASLSEVEDKSDLFEFAPESFSGECDLCGTYHTVISIGYGKFACENCVCVGETDTVCMDCGKEIKAGVERYDIGNNDKVCRECFVAFRCEEFKDDFVPQKETLFEV